MPNGQSIGFRGVVLGVTLWGFAVTSSWGDPARLEAELARFSTLSGGTLGIAAKHLGTGETVVVNGGERYPMASSYKVAIAVRLLYLVDEGAMSLTDMVPFEAGHYSPGSGTLSRLFDDPGLSLSVLNCLELMLLISDNSATDMCLSLAGGGGVVTEHMRKLGVDGLRVDRSTYRLISDYLGIEPKKIPPVEERDGDTFSNLLKDVPADVIDEAKAAFGADERDTCTPEGMLALLEGIWRGRFLSETSTALLKDIMLRCETGDNRLKGILPPGTPVAHKTGTIGGTTNDVGVIELPAGAGEVVVVALIKDSAAEGETREAAIAQAARAVYDYFLFHGPATP